MKTHLLLTSIALLFAFCLATMGCYNENTPIDQGYGEEDFFPLYETHILRKHGHGLNSVCGTENGFVAVGEGGVIVFSENDTIQEIALEDRDRVTTNLHKVAYQSGKGLIALGDNGTILYSDYGKNWHKQGKKLGLSGVALHSICSSNKGFVIVGEKGTILFSADGKNWAQKGEELSLKGTHLNSVCITANQEYVAVGDSGVILLSEDGENWERKGEELQLIGKLFSVCASSKGIVASGENMVYSPNGQDWALFESGADNVSCNEHGFIMTGLDHEFEDPCIFQSMDGKNWFNIYSTYGGSFHVSCGSKDGFVVCGHFEVLYSNKGLDWWEMRPNFVEGYYTSVCSSSRGFVAVTSSGTIVAISKSGEYVSLPASIKITNLANDSFRLEVKLKTKNNRTISEQDEPILGLHGVLEYQHREGTADFRPIEVSFIRKDSINHPDTWEGYFALKKNGIAVEPGRDSEKYLLKLSKYQAGLYQQFLLKNRYTQYFKVEQSAIEKFIGKHQYLLLSISAYYLAFCLLWLLSPISILAIHQKVPISILVGALPSPFNVILVFINIVFPVSALAHSERALNAWVRINRSTIREKFIKSNTVTARTGYVQLPIRMGHKDTGELIEKPSPELLTRIFDGSRCIIQIEGVGGSGKTTLACKIGNWLLDESNLKLTGGVQRLPVIVEEDTQDVVKLLSRYLTAWLQKEVRTDLVVALIKSRRLVVIIDALSEMNHETQKYFEEIHGTVPLNALLITGRKEFSFRAKESLMIYPQPLSSTNLLHFITSLLQKYDNHPLSKLEDQLEFAQKIANLFRSGDKEVPVTPILVKIVVENMIKDFSSGLILQSELIKNIPNTIPQVYFDYLEKVNPKDPDVANYLPDEQMFRVAKLMGKLSLGESMVPQDFQLENARKATAEILPDLESDPVQRLIDNGILTKRRVAGNYFLRFNLDPVAEYLAAFWYAEECGRHLGGIDTFINDVLKELDDNATGFKIAFWLITKPDSIYDKIFGWSK